MCIYCGAAQDMAWDIAGVRQPPPPLLHLCVSDERELPQPPHVGRHHLALHTAGAGKQQRYLINGDPAGHILKWLFSKESK